MHSAQGHQIDNEQIDEISTFEANQFPTYVEQYAAVWEVCAEPTPRFNCHGLTFGARRTGIYEPEALRQILEEDGYREIQPQEVKSGDVILYYASDGDCEHSGLVVEPPRPGDNLGVPMVRSKWGKYRELIHPASRCPYSFANVKYFRVRA